MSNLNKIEQCIQDMRFRDELINAMSKDDSLLTFIDVNLIIKTKNERIVKNNINSLKKLNENDVLIVKARAKQLEENLDPSKYFPTILGVFGLLMIIFRLPLVGFSELEQNSFSLLIGILIGVIAIFLFLSLVRIQKKRGKAIYFNSLITNIHK
ncbi:hypothetical protein [Lysinibacillus xylanilyticus]|uniref:hypothetical protein n=1 Tax=Lysinibacillus xylanilyticus TaxID=582475 RepID=UPI003CFD5DE8